MNKSELVETVALTADISKASANRALEAVLEAITKTLQNGDTVTLVGFGSFLIKNRAARQGRNPKTGEPLQIPASKVVGFKPGKTLKDAVN
jgi:DNA-binding protein HU-beta